MSDGLEDADVAVETHGLLLSLAGLIDDELLGWCRELVAVGESEYALELVTASVQADRVRLPEQLHANLQDTAIRHRALGRADTLPSPDPSPRMRHKFSTDPTEHGFPAQPFGPSPEEALRLVPSRLLRDCKLWLTWRLTPAGGAPTPLPHPVVLVETSDVLGAEALAYQVAEVLSRAGVFASVEVFSGDLELGEYHRAALAEAQSMTGPDGTPEPPQPERSVVSGTAPVDQVPPRPSPRARVAPGPNGAAGRGPAGPLPDAPRPGPDGGRRPPMHPVDRVITARSSAPRRPRPDRQPGSLDDVAAGLNFERGVVNGDLPADAPADGAAERPQSDRAQSDRPQSDRPQSERPPADRPPADRRPERPREPGWGNDQPPPGQQRPQPPLPERTGGMRPAPPGAGGPLPKRPAPGPRPVDPPDATELSDVEQRLLRQLHEELAAREDESGASLPDQDQPPSRIFRSANGGRKRPPRGGPERAN
jgi:hypothetical protein